MAASSGGEFKLDEYVIGHVSDSQEWHLPFLPTIHIPEPFSLHSVMLLLASAILSWLFCVAYKKEVRTPNGLTNFLEVFVVFIRDEIAIANLGKEDGRQLTPLLCTMFFFILTLNLLGLIPAFSTATANYSVTGALATAVLGYMIFGAIAKNGVGGFFKAFMPAGVPIFVLPLIMLIEILGLFIKSFALMVRLFANLLAGHIVIFSLLGLIALLGTAALPAVFLALFIYLIEVIVAFVQAYIFTLLAAIFIGLTLHPDH